MGIKKIYKSKKEYSTLERNTLKNPNLILKIVLVCKEIRPVFD